MASFMSSRASPKTNSRFSPFSRTASSATSFSPRRWAAAQEKGVVDCGSLRIVANTNSRSAFHTAGTFSITLTFSIAAVKTTSLSRSMSGEFRMSMPLAATAASMTSRSLKNSGACW
eukprot:CAMPEP_0115061370 /NCGR_PEP_ID=MMETSP0227-20121206/7967_1 /TAXON_ID=89957 /ORGANISM="Polarella glacialis, Strain CCMP 1383" /LENGTH=116 /DNA_ID=CAMNT_0002446659 /DNA_START=248 /DNA_END=595 /DNA_ORIENTATION=-